jgi:hypothetical protein
LVTKRGGRDMKKIFAILMITMLVLCGIAYAGNVATTEIMDTTFNAVTTTANSTAGFLQGADKVSFFVVYDETEVGNSISAAVTCQISYDNSHWLSASFYDYAGGATLQTSETISADGYYYFWFNKDLCVPYVRVIVTATNTDADDLLTVKVYAASKE